MAEETRGGRVSDEELREMAAALPLWSITEARARTFEALEQVRDQTEQRVRRETLEWVLDQTNTLDANIYNIVTEELRRAAESEPKEVKDAK